MKNLKFKISHIISEGNVEGFVDNFYCADIEESVIKQKIEISYNLSAIESEILLSGHISGQVIFECSRCLDTFPVKLNVKINRIFPTTEQQIDVSEEIRQLLILNLPNKPLCKQNCLGICSKCGKNLNKGNCDCSEKFSDPRWEKLKLLKKDNN